MQDTGPRTDGLMRVDDFVDLLTQLDRFIDSRNPEMHMAIRAIGGFSLMYLEQETTLTMLRMGSSDIDTLTHLPRDVAAMVDIIATNNGVNSDWLNDRWYANHDFSEELEPYIIWEPTKYMFDHIDLKVANLEGVFLMKIRSVCDALEFVGYPSNSEMLGSELRTQDVVDVVSLFRFFGIESVEDFGRVAIPIAIEGIDRFVDYFVAAGILVP